MVHEQEKGDHERYLYMHILIKSKSRIINRNNNKAIYQIININKLYKTQNSYSFCRRDYYIDL